MSQVSVWLSNIPAGSWTCQEKWSLILLAVNKGQLWALMLADRLQQKRGLPFPRGEVRRGRSFSLVSLFLGLPPLKPRAATEEVSLS